jgi:predicted adenine nucleotide alpha hydrolase (AANH) superfamily ATPase
MSREEAEYYQRRAEAEIELAQRASHIRAVQAHYELASAYLDRIHGAASAPREPAAA